MKYLIVTGASTGIGREVSLALAREGFFVYLLARNEKKLRETQKFVKEAGGGSEIISVDLSSLAEINRAITTVKNKTDKIDLLANIAGIWHGNDDVYAGKDLETLDQKVIIDTYWVGTIAPTLFAHAFIPLMTKGSKIVNLSGTFENGAKGWLPYYVSKRAIEDLTVALAQELEDKDIQVNCVSPSDTATEAYAKYFPQYMGEAIDPILIAKKIVELTNPDDKTTGKIFVMKKDEMIKEGFHK